jgi:hypothetical protein
VLRIEKPQKSLLVFLLVQYEKSLKNDLFKLTFLNNTFFKQTCRVIFYANCQIAESLLFTSTTNFGQTDLLRKNGKNSELSFVELSHLTLSPVASLPPSLSLQSA